MHKLILALAIIFMGPSLTLPARASIEDERALAPLIDLQSGGQSTGAAQGAGATAGGLDNGSLLPDQGRGYETRGRDEIHWGSGMMISLIVNSAAALANDDASSKLYIGSIAKEHGGAFPPHKSHQNGLDADFLFLGTTSYDSVLDKDGKVTDAFDLEKNWHYWRMITSQRVRIGESTPSAVSMILVDPRLKTHICSWAEGRKDQLDALDMEVLKKLRPTEGHDNHFHLRLRCSPYYEECIVEREWRNPPTGCAGLD